MEREPRHGGTSVPLCLLAMFGCAGSGENTDPSSGTAPPLLIDIAAEVGLGGRVPLGETFPGLSSDHADFQRFQGQGAAVGDIDNDGDLDIYLLAPLGHPNRLWLNQDGERFEDGTLGSGLGDTGASRVAHFVHLDDDTFLDLILLSDRHPDPQVSRSRLFRNNGDGTFSDVTEGLGFDPQGYIRAGMTLCDVDRDGRLDIFVTNWAAGFHDSPVFPGTLKLYRGTADFVFADIGEEQGVEMLAVSAFSAICTDLTGDGYPEIYAAQDAQSDILLLNNKGTSFTNVATLAGTSAVGSGMGVAVGDVNRDGELDIFVTHISTGNRQNYLYVRNGTADGVPTFEEQAIVRGVHDSKWAWGTAFFDLEHDGDLDLGVANGWSHGTRPGYQLFHVPSVLFVNEEPSQFETDTTSFHTPMDSRSLVPFDFDNDGDLDVLITNVGDRAELYENRAPKRGEWLVVHLIGQGRNRSAIGASVVVETKDGIRLRRDVFAGGGFLGGPPQDLHFGLGTSGIERMTVSWPDGTQETLPDPVPNQTVTLRQGFSKRGSPTVPINPAALGAQAAQPLAD